MPNDKTFVSDLDLATRYGVTRTTVWRWVKTLGFPRPVKIGEACTRWRFSEVLAWEASRAEAAE